jgi:anti-anti-sigma factor
MEKETVATLTAISRIYFRDRMPHGVHNVAGRIDSNSYVEKFKPVEDQFQEGRFHQVVDLSGVEYMSAAGLRWFNEASRICRRYNRGELVILDPQRRILDAFHLIDEPRTINGIDTKLADSFLAIYLSHPDNYPLKTLYPHMNISKLISSQEKLRRVITY